MAQQMSRQQLADEKRKEDAFNSIFVTVIQYFPWGQWYFLMKMASSMLTEQLPKRIGIDKDGRPIVIYKGDVNKLLGVWLQPSHEIISKDLGRIFTKGNDKSDWTKFSIDMLSGGGQFTEMYDQYDKKNRIFDISPDEFDEQVAKRSPEALKKLNEIQLSPEQKAKFKATYPAQYKKLTGGKLTSGKKVAIASVSIIGGLLLIGVLIGMFKTQKT